MIVTLEKLNEEYFKNLKDYTRYAYKILHGATIITYKDLLNELYIELHLRLINKEIDDKYDFKCIGILYIKTISNRIQRSRCKTKISTSADIFEYDHYSINQINLYDLKVYNKILTWKKDLKPSKISFRVSNPGKYTGVESNRKYKKISEMQKQGMTIPEIAGKLGCARGSIYYQINRWMRPKN